jgi:predicted component of type VI protein secretion system
MGGINHIDFIPGRIADKSEEIRDLLVARGLLEEVTKQ